MRVLVEETWLGKEAGDSHGGYGMFDKRAFGKASARELLRWDSERAISDF